jgi:hypothetical protein
MVYGKLALQSLENEIGHTGIQARVRRGKMAAWHGDRFSPSKSTS